MKHFLVVAQMEMLAILRRPFNLLIYLGASALTVFAFLAKDQSMELPLCLKAILGVVLVGTFPGVGLPQLLEDRTLILTKIERGTAAVCGLAYTTVQGIVLALLCLPSLVFASVTHKLQIDLCIYSFVSLVMSGAGIMALVYLAAIYLSFKGVTQFTEMLGVVFSLVGFVAYISVVYCLCLLVNDMARQFQVAAAASTGFALLSVAVLCFGCRGMPRQTPCMNP